MRKFFSLLLVGMALSGAALSVARADDVYLLAGDHLIGTVTTVEAGKLTLHSEDLGDTVIPMDKIRTFSTDKPLEIKLTDGTRLSAAVAQSDPGDIAVNNGKIPLGNIDLINPVLLTGSFSLGGSLVRGNSFADNLDADFKLGYKVDSEQFTLNGDYTYGDTKNIVTNVRTTSTDRWELYGKYQHFFSKKFYGYVDADLTKDRIAALDLRFAPSGGLGYQWLDKAPLMFGTEAGVGWLYQKYTNGTATHEPLDVKFAYHLTYDITSSVTLFNDLTYYPTIPKISDYFITADLGLHTKLNKHLFTEVKIEWEYNSFPATGALKNDTQYIANIGYTL